MLSSTRDQVMTDSPRNAKLTSLYCRHWPVPSELLACDERLSTPYLAWVHPDYETADIRLVVVGKEANGWEDRSRVMGLAAR